MDWLRALVADIRHNWKPKLKRFRLHIFAFALFAVGILESVDPYALQAVMPQRWQPFVLFGFGGIIWLLRKATSHPPTVTTTYHEEAITDHVVADDGDHTHDDRVL